MKSPLAQKDTEMFFFETRLIGIPTIFGKGTTLFRNRIIIGNIYATSIVERVLTGAYIFYFIFCLSSDRKYVVWRLLRSQVVDRLHRDTGFMPK